MNNRNKWLSIGFLQLSAFVILMLASRSSFLYCYNDWCDANSYFSVGKALFNGKLPYRDVFDQKGMYLYFFYGLSYLISHKTFLGVFILEVVFGFFDIAGIYHILQLYLKKSIAVILSPVALAVTFSSYAFYEGGAAEEICFPFLIWGLYLGLRYFKQEYPEGRMKTGTLLTVGILAGMVANIKFTVLGFFFGWMMWVAFSYLVRKDLTGALKACGVFLLGMVLPFIPWVIYFALKGGLQYWYWGYVYINVFLYSNLGGDSISLGERLYTLAKLLYWLILDDLVFFIPLVPGVLYLVFQKGAKWMARLFVPVLFLFLFLGIYVGGSVLPYYALPLAVFAGLGLIPVGLLIEKILTAVSAESLKKDFWLPFLGGMVTLALSLWLVYGNSIDIPALQQKREEHFLYKFSQIVEKEENPTLLNINCLDAGLYTVCDIVPTCQWFQTQTIHLDLVYEEQERYIKEGQTMFVLARDTYPEVIFEQYELAGQEPWWNIDGTEFTYYLFRRKK